jgi:hypothetical protein
VQQHPDIPGQRPVRAPCAARFRCFCTNPASRVGHPNEAAAEFEAAVHFDPAYAEAHDNLQELVHREFCNRSADFGKWMASGTWIPLPPPQSRGRCAP